MLKNMNNRNEFENFGELLVLYLYKENAYQIWSSISEWYMIKSRLFVESCLFYAYFILISATPF